MKKAMSRRAVIALVAGAASISILGGTAIGYNVYYADRIVPGVTVMGQTTHAMTAEELRTMLNERVEAATVTLTLEGESHTVPLADLGVHVDVDAAVAKALEPSNSLGGRISTPFQGLDVTLTHTVDEAALQAYADKLISADNAQVKEASVTFDAASASYSVTPGHPGKTLNVDDIRAAASKAAQDLAPTSATIPVSVEEPVVSTEAATAYAEKAQKMLDVHIEITDGIDTFSPEKADKSAWLKKPEAGKELGEPAVDSAKVAEWVKATAKRTAVVGKPGVKNVNSKGQVVSIHESGESGWTTNNEDAIAKDVEEAFRQGKDFNGTFTYDKTEPEMETRIIADGDKAHIYAATPGERWVDIDLTNNTVSGYEGGTIVYGPSYMVPGAPETPTITGTFRVWHQNALQTMRGYNADGTKYETPNVPWATYFHGDFAIHGAPWRSSFGWSGPGGSHGCVNMQVEDAKWFYDFVDIGTVVVSHY